MLKKYHFTNTPNSRENSELKSDSKKLDFEYKEALWKRVKEEKSAFLWSQGHL